MVLHRSAGVLSADPARATLLLLAANWKIVGLATLVGAALGVGLHGALPKWYSSEAKLAVLALDDPVTPGGINAIDGAQATLPVLVAVLRSRGVAAQTVESLGLERVYNAPTQQEAVVALGRHVAVTSERKSNLISVIAEDHDRARAREIAATIARLGSERNAQMWSARSHEHRIALEARLKDVTRDLAKAEQAMLDFRQKHRVVDLPTQVRVSVEQAAALQRLHTAKMLDLRYTRGYAGAGAWEVARVARERSGIEQELGALVHGDTTVQDPFLSIDELPTLEIEHDRLKRTVELTAERYEKLAREVDDLRTAEARSVGRTEVVDAPALAIKPSRPSRPLYAGAGAMAGLVIALALVLLTAAGPRQAVAA